MYDSDFIETPENVALERPLAGLGSRFIALLIDGLVLGLLLFALVLLVMALAGFDSLPEVSRWAALILLATGMFFLTWGYFTLCEGLLRGKTVGKSCARLRVVSRDGGPASLADVIIRNLIRPVDVLGPGVIAIFAHPKHQRLGDMAAGTVVVSEEVANYGGTDKRQKRRRKARGELTASELLSIQAATDHPYLSEDEARLLRSYWQRREDLSPKAREALQARIVPPIARRLGHDMPNNPSVLDAYIHHLLETPEQPWGVRVRAGGDSPDGDAPSDRERQPSGGRSP